MYWPRVMFAIGGLGLMTHYKVKEEERRLITSESDTNIFHLLFIQGVYKQDGLTLQKSYIY